MNKTTSMLVTELKKQIEKMNELLIEEDHRVSAHDANWYLLRRTRQLAESQMVIMCCLEWLLRR